MKGCLSFASLPSASWEKEPAQLHLGCILSFYMLLKDGKQDLLFAARNDRPGHRLEIGQVDGMEKQSPMAYETV